MPAQKTPFGRELKVRYLLNMLVIVEMLNSKS